MLKLLTKQLLQMLLVLWGVITLVFFLFTVLPGDPAQMMLDQNENSEQLAHLKRKYGFDLPIGQQYLYYLNDLSPLSIHPTTAEHFAAYRPQVYGGVSLFSGTHWQWVLKQPYFRTSYQKTGKPVASILLETLPHTIVLAVASIAIGVLLGVLFGTLAMFYKDQWIDRVLLFISTLGISVPSFFSAILFSWLFGYVFKDITGLSMTGSLYHLDDYGESYSIRWRNLILPATVLGIRPLALVTQLVRSSLIEVWQADYIRTARSKGLSSIQILWRHALKNALTPVVTAASGWFASLLAGAVFVEYIFGWKGLGREIVAALNGLDIPVIMGAVITIAFIFTLINFCVDWIYMILDPRVKNHL